MPYFNRLTDIVSCDLSSLLAMADDQRRALTEIMGEMQEGVEGARRWVEGARANEERLRESIRSHEEHAVDWAEHARDHLRQGAEGEARHCLLIKKEHEDMAAALTQQLEGALVARESCLTQLRALEAKLADAQRRQEALERGEPVVASSGKPGWNLPTASGKFDRPVQDDRLQRANAELELLKKELGVG